MTRLSGGFPASCALLGLMLLSLALPALCMAQAAPAASRPAGNHPSRLSNDAGPPPTIISFSPTTGPQNTPIVITGANFNHVSQVTLAGRPLSSVVVNSNTQITASVPPYDAYTGPISVTTPAGTATTTNVFTVIEPPYYTSFTPNSGPVGTTVTIMGSSFQGVTVVSFRNARATSFTINSAGTQIVTTVPSGAESGPLALVGPGGIDEESISFTVTSNAPTITSFTPASGPAGTAVTITGMNLTGTTVVGFMGQHATSFSVSQDGTQITTTVPVGAVTGPVAVLTNGVEVKSSAGFTVPPPPPPPTITGFSPASGPAGTPITITGTNLAGTTIVGFMDKHAVAFTISSDGTQITTTVPAGAVTGPVAVLTNGVEAKSATDFTVIP